MKKLPTGLIAMALAIGLTFAPTAKPILAAVDAEHAGVSDKQITIGSCCVLSGPAAQLGIQQLYGAKAYFDYINDKGGVFGRKLVINEYDDKYDADQAIITFRQLVKDECFAGAFFVGTPTGAKHVVMAETNAVPLVGMFTGAQILREPLHPHVFHIRASYWDETEHQIDELLKDCGKNTTVGIIFQDDAFGAAVMGGYKRALAKYGAKPVAIGSYKRNSTDVDDAIKMVKAANPDFVGVIGQYATVSAIVKRSKALGWNPLFGTVSFVGTEAFIKDAGKDAEGVVITQVVPSYDRTDLPTIELYKKLLHKYFPAQQPGFSSLEGFVDAMVVVDALKGAGKDLTRTKFIQALESMHDKDLGLGPTLKLNYSQTRHTGLDAVYFTVVKNGHATLFSNWKEVMPKH